MEHFIAIVVGLVLGFLFTLFAREIARKTGFLDIPKDDRKIHAKPMPVMGGFGILLAIIIGSLLVPGVSLFNNIPFVLGMVGITVLGMLDDRFEMRAIYKLIGQLLIAFLFVMSSPQLLQGFQLGAHYIEIPAFISFMFSTIWIVAIMNIINLIDGLDGLATGVTMIILGSFFILFLGSDPEQAVFIIFMISILGGFLYFNFNPASIFLGDQGSMLLGFIIAAISLSSMKTATLTTMIPLLLIMSIPILDTGMAIIRRLIMEEHIFKPDGKHLHHMLLKKGYTQKGVALLIYAITASYAAWGIFLSSTKEPIMQAIIAGIIIIETLVIIERIYIVNPHYKPFSKLWRKIKSLR